MFELKDGKVILRDFIETDIEKRIYWETVETEWQSWDGPWEYERRTKKEAKAELEVYIKKMRFWVEKFRRLNSSEKRTSFQICERVSGEYIGWCNSYRINDTLTPSSTGKLCAVGIDIPEISARGKGYASAALKLFIDYLHEHGEPDIYIQTWSGNVRMINLALKLGFEEYMRKKDLRFVRGEYYDGLTFILNTEKYNKHKGVNQ